MCALELEDRLDVCALELEDRLDLCTTLARDLPLSDRVFRDFAGRNRDFPLAADRLDLLTLARDLPLSDLVFRDFTGRNHDFPLATDRLDLLTLARDLPLSDRVFRDFTELPGIQFYLIHFFVVDGTCKSSRLKNQAGSWRPVLPLDPGRYQVNTVPLST